MDNQRNREQRRDSRSEHSRASEGPLTVARLEQLLLERYPREDAEPWDRTGLLAGDSDAVVTGVAVALDPTREAIVEAKRIGANVLLTHHPPFLHPPRFFSPSYDVAVAPGVSVYTAAAQGVALINFHTAQDASVEATRMFPRMLGLEFDRLLKPLASDPDKGYAISCHPPESARPFTLGQLAARVTTVFGRPPRVWGEFSKQVDDIVIGNGGAAGVVDVCVERRVDCLVCGELSYHNSLNASQSGLSIVEIGHDISEFPLTCLLARAAEEAGVPRERITVLDQSAKWAYPDDAPEP